MLGISLFVAAGEDLLEVVRFLEFLHGRTLAVEGVKLDVRLEFLDDRQHNVPMNMACQRFTLFKFVAVENVLKTQQIILLNLVHVSSWSVQEVENGTVLVVGLFRCGTQAKVG